MNLNDIGKLIKERREFLNLRQEDLSELSEINTRTIHLIEQGKANPSYKTLVKVSEVLGLEVIIKTKQIN
jgi:transcriptional regulator with XRE-family HTH domain